MRFHSSPVHDNHAFIQLIRMIDPQPEFQPLADFIRFTRKTYQNGKFLKKYVQNIGNLYKLQHVKIYYEKTTGNLRELEFFYEQMVTFINDPPPILYEVQFLEVLEQLQGYFDPSTKLHQQFLDTILFWLDKAADLLEQSSEINNSVLDDSFNTTHNEFPGLGTAGGVEEGFSNLDISVTRPLNLDQPTTLPPAGLTQPGGLTSDRLSQLGATQGPDHTESERFPKIPAARKVGIDDTFIRHDTFRLGDTLEGCEKFGSDEARKGYETFRSDEPPKGREDFDDFSEGLKAARVSYPENKPSLLTDPRTQERVASFVGTKNKDFPLEFTDKIHTSDLNTKDLVLKGYSKVVSSESKNDFTIETPRKSEILNKFTAGVTTNFVPSLPTKSAFLPPESSTSQPHTTTTLQTHLVPSRQPPDPFASHRTRLGPNQQPTHILPPRQPSGSQSQHLDISRVSPRILQLELSTLIADIQRLKQKILALHDYANGLGSANDTTNSTLKEYTKDAIKLTDRTSKLFDRFDEKISVETRAVMESIFTSASDLTNQLSNLHPTCSTDLVSPCVSASLLKNVRIPRLNVSTFVSPGFYCQAKDLLNHIDTNPFQARYYVDQVWFGLVMMVPFSASVLAWPTK